jgi:O-antigen ligase
MSAKNFPEFTLVEKVAALLLLLYPTLMFVIKGGMNSVFLCMILLALAVRIVPSLRIKKVEWCRDWTSYVLAMLAMSVAIFITQLYHQKFDARPYDAASRYWLAILVFLMLIRFNPKVFRVLQVAFPIAVIITLPMAREWDGRTGIDTLDLIHYGDFALVLGVMSLFSINWFGCDNLPLRTLKVLGFVAGVYASVASGSRGGWLAIPLFIAIYVYFQMPRISKKLFVLGCITATLTAAISYLGSNTVSQRLDYFRSEVTTFNEGNRDTSTGVRWQLYKAAVEIIAQHPMYGVGPQGFALEMQPLQEAGKITPLAAQYGRGEVHNDILSKAVGMGVFGLVAIIAIYLVPLGMFWRATKSSSEIARRSGVLGITFVSGFMVFGLTVEILNLTMATAFFGFTVAVLLAACYNTSNGERGIALSAE